MSNKDKAVELLREALELLTSPDSPSPPVPPVPSNGKKIVIDVGHSKTSEGAKNLIDGKGENAFNWEIARLIKPILETEGFEVVLIDRFPHNSISRECREINALSPDVVVSIHYNSSESNASGTETFYWFGSSKGEKLASLIQSELVEVLALPDRGAIGKNSGNGSAFLKGTQAPSVLLEPFFGDNREDCKAVERVGKQGLARAIAAGIIAYFC